MDSACSLGDLLAESSLWAPQATAAFLSAQTCYWDNHWHPMLPLPAVLSPPAALFTHFLSQSHLVIKMPPPLEYL